MGLFDSFKKDKTQNNQTTDNGIPGPKFLNDFTSHITNPNDLQSHEWRRQIKTSAGQTKFKIKYYGQLHEEYQSLIVSTDFAPSLIFAVDESSGQEILLFDGCKHGYNALFCDTYTQDQIAKRIATNLYKDKEGNDSFEIIISTYNGIDYDDEFADQVDENGLIETIDGSKVEFEDVKRLGYDTLQIWATNVTGKTIEIVSEELA